MMRVVTILQARFSSRRLPGKVLMDLMGRPMLARQIERVRRAALTGVLIIATSQGPDDDVIENLCGEIGVECFRGSLDDVLDRFYQAAKIHQPDHVVRLTGDCPLADPDVIDSIIKAHLDRGNDYTSNTITPTYPDGLDVEVMGFDALHDAWREAKLKSEREHVTPFIKNQPDRYRLYNVSHETDLNDLRWTVDEPEDFDFVKAVYDALFEKKPGFTMNDILDLLKQHPELLDMNSHHIRDEGYLNSLANDNEIT